ncbi:MAG TPA: alpha-E domain-containing protein [Anaerolineae bacterium]|nr:alpha-E domain-containing protein [Anaerolineae bacterium]
MLSRVAESLYWLARYIERAEDVTRLLAVNFNALLDAPLADNGRGWRSSVAITGDESLFAEVFGQAQTRAVIEFLLWHSLNPNAVMTCITRARENARSVREQISSEMWEHINRLYFLIREVNRERVLDSPTEFFQKVRDGSQAFQGVAAATMTHGEAYQFLQLGQYLERADKTVRILDVQYTGVSAVPDGSAEAALLLIALLRSCSAFEPFRRTPGLALTTASVAEYLLLNHTFPRAVLFCVNRCVAALDAMDQSAAPLAAEFPRRALGRLSAELEYLDIRDVLGNRVDEFLNRLLVRLNAVGDDIARTYFNTRVILPSERPSQQQQQQQ